ncbi:ML domain-containing protein [Kalaharituber pfeilii]|nr:ML domain-containing protein [Kalaharituber pfeilii]
MYCALANSVPDPGADARYAVISMRRAVPPIAGMSNESVSLVLVPRRALDTAKRCKDPVRLKVVWAREQYEAKWAGVRGTTKVTIICFTPKASTVQIHLRRDQRLSGYVSCSGGSYPMHINVMGLAYEIQARDTRMLAASVSAASLWGQSPLSNPPPGDPVPGDNPLHYCGTTKSDILIIDNVDISPNPPVPGATLTITATGTLKEEVGAGAYIDVEVKYGYIKLIHQQIDFCENAGQVDLACPIKEGDLSLTKKVDLPKAIPPGKYHVSANAWNADGEHITCLFADVIFKPHT